MQGVDPIWLWDIQHEDDEEGWRFHVERGILNQISAITKSGLAEAVGVEPTLTESKSVVRTVIRHLYVIVLCYTKMDRNVFCRERGEYSKQRPLNIPPTSYFAQKFG